jgi:hypothetical protein
VTSLHYFDERHMEHKTNKRKTDRYTRYHCCIMKMLIGTFEISKCITIKCCPSSLIALYKRNRLGYTNILFIHKRRKDLILSGHYKINCTLCCTYLIGATQPAECSSAGLTQTERKISQFPFASRYPPI